ncbi:MAG: hypothetical protein GKR89_22375 [Candidatus Latescibacteria bacterium]|nr:hypothetical protein [Candidatus Latescibacterota bacterium]
MRRFFPPVLIAGLLAWSPAQGQDFSQLFIFGDSLSDIGNIRAASLNTVPASPPYFEGRFSNGPNYTDILAERLGLGPLQPSLLLGTNYAWGGAWGGADTRQSILLIPSILTQVGQFIATLEGTQADGEALYIVLGGGNDVEGALDDGLDADSGAERMSQAAQSLIQATQLLLDNGAMYLMVVDTPDLSTTPRHLDRSTARDLSALVNQELAQGLVDMPVIRLANATIHAAMEADFTISDASCLGAGMIGESCDNPDDFFYFDDFHPTTAGHAMLTGLVLQALEASMQTVARETSWGQLKAALHP